MTHSDTKLSRLEHIRQQLGDDLSPTRKGFNNFSGDCWIKAMVPSEDGKQLEEIEFRPSAISWRRASGEGWSVIGLESGEKIRVNLTLEVLKERLNDPDFHTDRTATIDLRNFATETKGIEDKQDITENKTDITENKTDITAKAIPEGSVRVRVFARAAGSTEYISHSFDDTDINWASSRPLFKNRLSTIFKKSSHSATNKNGFVLCPKDNTKLPEREYCIDGPKQEIMRRIDYARENGVKELDLTTLTGPPLAMVYVTAFATRSQDRKSGFEKIIFASYEIDWDGSNNFINLDTNAKNGTHLKFKDKTAPDCWIPGIYKEGIYKAITTAFNKDKTEISLEKETRPHDKSKIVSFESFRMPAKILPPPRKP